LRSAPGSAVLGMSPPAVMVGGRPDFERIRVFEGVENFDHAAYLQRLAVERLGEPSVAGLHALHRAQVERVAYETIGINAGQLIPLEPTASAKRIIAGWGGYCYNLNGAFAMLLSALGYQVRLHIGGVTGH